MTTSPVRRAAVLAVTVVFAALLVPLGLWTPAAGDAAGGVPGVPRADAAQLTAGKAFGCAIVADGSVRCWGANASGQLAQGNKASVGDNPGESTVRVDLGAGRTAVALTAGDGHACAILDNTQLRCWGNNASGQLGQGNVDNVGDDPAETTVAVDLGPGRTAVAVTAGETHTCALLDTGHLRCWGSNGFGQLGQGHTDAIGDTFGEIPVAVDLGPGRTAVAVTAGGPNTCAVLDTGQLRCWGYNGTGQLGQGNTTNIGDNPGETTVAVDLGPGRTAIAVAIGDFHTCAVLDTGQLRCWGDNGFGQLGQGNKTHVGDNPGETTAAVDLGPGRTAVAVSAGESHTCAVLDTGQLRCWGDSGFGQLGQGNNTAIGDSPGETTVAVDLGPGRTTIAATAGEHHTCAVLDTRQLRCWGRNGDGQLGQGTLFPYGASAGETPAGLPPVNLGGQLFGGDTDGDGVRDAVDTCRTVPGTLANGCPAAAVAPPEAVLKGKKVLLDAVVAKKRAPAKCPARATVTVKTKSSKGRVMVTKQVKTKTVTGGCRVKGKISLHSKPKATAKVKVTITGTKLTKKRLLAVRL